MLFFDEFLVLKYIGVKHICSRSKQFLQMDFLHQDLHLDLRLDLDLDDIVKHGFWSISNLNLKTQKRSRADVKYNLKYTHPPTHHQTW